MEKTVAPTIEELEQHHLRLDLDSIKAAGYDKAFARKHLIDRFVNLDTHMTEETFDRILAKEYSRKG